MTTPGDRERWVVAAPNSQDRLLEKVDKRRLGRSYPNKF